jgi:N-acyl-D-aspartate/D-glutamate deacylase
VIPLPGPDGHETVPDPAVTANPRTAIRALLLLAVLVLTACGRPSYSVIIRGGTVYDGSGLAGIVTDIGLRGDSIAVVGDLFRAHAPTVIDARGKAVAPGFVNMLSWAGDALMADGRSQSDIRQGVTLEVFGEGESMGPFTSVMVEEAAASQGDIRFPITWHTLGGYLDTLVARGVSPNVASFVGAATVRRYVLGHAPRAASPEELQQMQELVRQAMQEGALGVGSSLIYEPGMFATTDELVALASAAARDGGMYISHIRNENDSLLDAVDEFLEIARRSGARAEIYHLKAAGRANWGKLEEMLRRIEAARAEGLQVTADMYPYPASATGLDAVMPGWVRAGGLEQWRGRLQDPAVRGRLKAEWRGRGGAFVSSGGPGGVLLIGFKSDSLKRLTGKTLEEIARLQGKSPEDAAMDLIIADQSRIECIYFTMSEENLRREIVLPWVGFGSDEGSFAPEGVFLKSNPHPRAYGTFARVLSKYVREEQLLSLPEAIRRLSALPAQTLHLRRRGMIRPGYFADVVVFDPATVQDHATFAEPRRYATGVEQVFVNGVQVLRDGEHTGAKPGRAVRPGGTSP